MRKGWLLIFALVGCGPPADRWMPLGDDGEWTYQVRAGIVDSVDVWAIEGDCSVGSSMGKRIDSPRGETCLGWVGGELRASDFAGTRYEPPIPLLAIDGSDRDWSGVAISPLGQIEASATLTHESVDITVGGREYEASKSVLAVDFAGEPRRLDTWFASGVGILRQELRERDALGDERLAIALEHLSGP